MDEHGQDWVGVGLHESESGSGGRIRTYDQAVNSNLVEVAS